MNQNTKSFYLLSLGCPKNLVDSESMSQLLKNENFLASDDPATADYLIVNTCGFIESAKKEAIEAILDLADYKASKGKAKALIVAGCLSQRYARDIQSDLPEVDAVLGTADYDKIATVLHQLDQGKDWRHEPQEGGSLSHLSLPRKPSTPKPYAYLKIAEGCSNLCAYCAIPAIRGPYQSRPLTQVLEEARHIVSLGYDEIILVAQDTTRYGTDLEGHALLPELLRRLSDMDGVRLIRILYAYADRLSDEIIAAMARLPKVASYLDLPIQHASDAILERMNRIDRQATLRERIGQLRQAMPDLILRSTVLVGFPGETPEDHQILLDFLREIRFDRLGCFVFSPEEGTAAFGMQPAVDPKVAQQRCDEVMQLQQEISLAKNRERIGSETFVTLESTDESGIFYLGRSYGEAPDIDPVIHVAATQAELHQGQTAKVRIVDADEYDLTGVTCDESTQ